MYILVVIDKYSNCPPKKRSIVTPLLCNQKTHIDLLGKTPCSQKKVSVSALFDGKPQIFMVKNLF